MVTTRTKDDSTFETWQARIRKFLWKDKRLRTGIIATTTGLSGVELSKDHTSEQLSALTALLGAFYSNMIDIREDFWKMRAPNEDESIFDLADEQATLEIGLGHVFTKNGASYKQFVSLTKKRASSDPSALIAFLAARGRGQITILDDWMALYDDIAPKILESHANDDAKFLQWNFVNMALESSTIKALLPFTSFFWTSDVASEDGKQALHQHARLMILALEDMLAFKATQGLWFEHHVITPEGIVLPQYFVFLFPNARVHAKDQASSDENRHMSIGSMNILLPLTIIPKCRAFIQLIANTRLISDSMRLDLEALASTWNLRSTLAKNEINDAVQVMRKSNIDTNRSRQVDDILNDFGLLVE